MNLLSRALQAIEEGSSALQQGFQTARAISKWDDVLRKPLFLVIQELEELSKRATFEQWNEAKMQFLHYSLTQFKPEKRLRTYDVYMLILLLEQRAYGMAPDFITDGDALP